MNCFQNALVEREKYGQPGPIRIAKWCVARCHRALGNLDEALTMQTELVNGEPSGYIYEELGEILLVQGKVQEAKPHFAKAVEMLSDELGPNSERIKRMNSFT